MSSAADAPIVSFSLRPWLRAARFGLRALRRRWLIASALLVLFTGAAVGAAIVLPRQYSGETRLLAKKNYTMPALAAPRRAVPLGSEAPAQSAAELALQRAALVQVVRQAKLVERYRQNAPSLQRAKQALRERLKGPLTPAELEDALVGLLRQRLRVTLEDNEVIRIRVTWWDPDDVLVILDQALAAFLQSRQRLDVETIAETRSILERNAAEKQALMQQRLAEFNAARARAAGASTALVSRHRAPAELEDLRKELVAQQRQRQELERQRELRIGDLQLKIAEHSATLGERHPDQIAAREALRALLDDDGGVALAAAQEAQLQRDFLARGGARADLSGDAGTQILDSADPEEDGSVIYARALLRMEVDDYQELMSRLNNARIELETARAAFQYRYMVTVPAERPRQPDSPNVPMVLIGGVMAGLFAAVLAALTLELRSRLAAVLREQLA